MNRNLSRALSPLLWLLLGFLLAFPIASWPREAKEVVFPDGQGYLRSMSRPNSEIELVAIPRELRRGIVRVEAEAYDRGNTGLYVSGGRRNYAGSIKLYVDSEPRVIITEQGLEMHEAAIVFNGGENYLAACGADLCWYSSTGVVNLTGGCNAITE